MPTDSTSLVTISDAGKLLRPDRPLTYRYVRRLIAEGKLKGTIVGYDKHKKPLPRWRVSVQAVEDFKRERGR